MLSDTIRVSATFDACSVLYKPLTVVENSTITVGDEVFDVPVATIKEVDGQLSLDGLKPEDKQRFADAVRKLGYD